MKKAFLALDWVSQLLLVVGSPLSWEILATHGWAIWLSPSEETKLFWNYRSRSNEWISPSLDLFNLFYSPTRRETPNFDVPHVK